MGVPCASREQARCKRKLAHLLPPPLPGLERDFARFTLLPAQSDGAELTPLSKSAGRTVHTNKDQYSITLRRNRRERCWNLQQAWNGSRAEDSPNQSSKDLHAAKICLHTHSRFSMHPWVHTATLSQVPQQEHRELAFASPLEVKE